jgi:hypothetical protein
MLEDLKNIINKMDLTENTREQIITGVYLKEWQSILSVMKAKLLGVIERRIITLLKQFCQYYEQELESAFEKVGNVQLIFLIVFLALLFSFILPFYLAKLVLIAGSFLKIWLTIFLSLVVLLLFFCLINLSLALFLRIKK